MGSTFVILSFCCAFFFWLSQTYNHPIISHFTLSILIHKWHNQDMTTGFPFESHIFALLSFSIIISRWVFSTRLISCSLWLPWKRWQTGREPLKQQHAFLFSHQDATGMQATRLSQHWALSSAQRNGLPVCMWVCGWACVPWVRGEKDTRPRKESVCVP